MPSAPLLRLLISVLYLSTAVSGLALAERSVAAKGEQALQELEVRSRSSPCWLAALQRVVASCKELTHESRVRLAVLLTRCHLEASGLHTAAAACDADMSVLECTAPLAATPLAFNTYTDFFIALDGLCFALESEQMQLRMENTIARLLASSASTAAHMADVGGAVQQLNEQQGALLAQQEALGRQQREAAEALGARLMRLQTASEATGRQLQETLALGERAVQEQRATLASVEALRAAQEVVGALAQAGLEAQQHLAREQAEFAARAAADAGKLRAGLAEAVEGSSRASAAVTHLTAVHARAVEQAQAALRELVQAAEEAKDRHEALRTTLGRVEALTKTLSAEMLDAQALVFYAATLGLSLLLTACRRLAGARLPSLLVLAVHFALERALVRGAGAMAPLVALPAATWALRRLTVLGLAALLAGHGWAWRDEQAEQAEAHARALQLVLAAVSTRSAPLVTATAKARPVGRRVYRGAAALQ